MSAFDDVLMKRARYAIAVGDCRATLDQLPDGCVQTCVTSPPYFGLRDYGVDGQIGQETSPAAFVEALVTVFREVRRVLAADGTLWLNLGDSYTSGGRQGHGATAGEKQQTNRGSNGVTDAKRPPTPDGLKAKDLMGIPWRVALALQADGWWLRSDIIWSKPNPMPESVTDRPTRAHEYVFLLTKSSKYFYDAAALREESAVPASKFIAATGANTAKLHATDGNDFRTHARGGGGQLGSPGARNARTVWSITPEPFDGAHFATMPPELARRCILAGSRRGDVVLDPFAGAGTTALVAVGNGRRAIGCELNPEYADLARNRIDEVDTSVAEPVRVVAPEWGALFGKAS